MSTEPLILVADDDDDILSFVVPSLHAAGYRTVQARNGADALRIAMSAKPDVALLDVCMPGLDGKAVTRVLRKSDGAPPVIFISARAAPRDRVEGYEAGASHYITKPFEIAELLGRVRAAVKESGAAAA